MLPFLLATGSCFLLVTTVVAAAAPSEGRGVHDQGSPPAARAISQAQAEWLKEMHDSAKNGDRWTRFPSPSRAVLMRRLQKAAKLYGFRIVSVQIEHPLQSAPLIVISSNSKQSIARATPTIVAHFDPNHPTSRNPSGYAYEGYFLIAQTTRAVPYLAAFNYSRAPHIGGGEWAASESLYPFRHWFSARAAQSRPTTGMTTIHSNDSPKTVVRRAQRGWRAALVTGASADPRTRFPAPPFSVLSARLAAVHRKYGFGWLYVSTFRPRQMVPLVTFKTGKKRAFARATPAILRLLDPKRNTGDDRTGWAYEGFFLKAVDENGTPFLIIYNHFRGPHPGGGQWAVRKDLLPFPHG